MGRTLDPTDDARYKNPKITAWVTKDLKQALDQRAVDAGRTLSDVLRELAEAWLEGKLGGSTLCLNAQFTEALDEVASGLGKTPLAVLEDLLADALPRLREEAASRQEKLTKGSATSRKHAKVS